MRITMKIWTKFATLWSILATTKVQCNSEYPPTESLHEDLELIGNEVIISCCGDVSVNGVLLVKGPCTGVQAPDHRQMTTKDMLLLSSQGSDTGDPLRTNHLEGGTFPLHGVTGTADEAGFDWTEMGDGSWWMLNGQPVQGITEIGGDLKLPSFGLADVGNYSCYRARRLISAVRFILRKAPERPTLNCRRKAPRRKIHCDWKATHPVSPVPKCYLILKNRRASGLSTLPCRYSTKHSRCRCKIGHEAPFANNSFYITMLFVERTSGNDTSREVHFTPQNVLKPDPPEQVKVTSVEGEEQMLKVSWSYPASWKWDNFFLLKFQLRYRPKHGEYQTVEIPEGSTPLLSWSISDALAHVEYEVQIRAIEVYGQGSWSDWTSPTYANTWTAPKTTESSDISQGPLVLMVIPGTPPKADSTQSPDVPSGLKQDHVVSIIGGCVGVIMFIFAIIQVLRHRIGIDFKSKREKLHFAPRSHGPPLQPATCKTKAQDCPPSLAPSQEPLHHQSPAHATKEDVHFQNISYFIMKMEPPS